MSKCIQLSSQDFKVLVSCMSTDQHRRQLSGFHITDKYIETTDGHKLVRIPLNESNYTDELELLVTAGQNIIAGTNSDIFGKIVEIPKTLKVGNNQSLVLMYNEGNIVTGYIVEGIQVINTVYLPFIDADYPDTNAAMSDYSESELEIGIGIDQLKDILKAYPNKGALKFKFTSKQHEFGLSVIEIYKNTGENEYKYLLMPVRV